jgi:hypothetical protein
MTIEEYEKKFLELLSCKEFIRDKKVKIQHFIQFDEPNTLEESMRKDKYLYEHNK